MINYAPLAMGNNTHYKVWDTHNSGSLILFHSNARKVIGVCTSCTMLDVTFTTDPINPHLVISGQLHSAEDVNVKAPLPLRAIPVNNRSQLRKAMYIAELGEVIDVETHYTIVFSPYVEYINDQQIMYQPTQRNY